MEQEKIVNRFLNFKGKSEIKTIPEENRETRKAVSKELMEKLDKKFS
jgi:hypothetical protein